MTAPTCLASGAPLTNPASITRGWCREHDPSPELRPDRPTPRTRVPATQQGPDLLDLIPKENPMPDQPEPLVDEDGVPLDPDEQLLYDAMRHMGCPSPVDPVDPDDCASVAIELVRVLRKAGRLGAQPIGYVSVCDGHEVCGGKPSRTFSTPIDTAERALHVAEVYNDAVDGPGVVFTACALVPLPVAVPE